MIAHLANTLADLSIGQVLGYAAYVATLAVLAVGGWGVDI